jgi:aminoglycoside 6'-N-acetyltransferase I
MPMSAAYCSHIRDGRMQIRVGSADDVEAWAQLRCELWPDGSLDEHREDLTSTFLVGDGREAAFMAVSDTDEIVGFAEAALRDDYVNGCDSSPVVFLEGIYVRPEDRRKGVARLLCNAVEAWGASLGCSEFASDALIDNSTSHILHAALGFEETERVVFFRKVL